MNGDGSVLPFQIGIIGGTGIDDPDILEGRTLKSVTTPFGKVNVFGCEKSVHFFTNQNEMFFPLCKEVFNHVTVMGLGAYAQIGEFERTKLTSTQ